MGQLDHDVNIQPNVGMFNKAVLRLIMWLLF